MPLLWYSKYMDNSTAHSTTSTSAVSASYVDAYMPPSSIQTSAPSVPASTSASAAMPGMDRVSMAQPAASTSPVQPDPIIQSPDLPPLETTQTMNATSSAPTNSADSEELEDQNIFTMLGVKDGTADQRETFLDELQQVIWEDFLEYDVKLLTTKEEQMELQKMIAMTGVSELEKQEKIVVYLEKLIPDLEEIMLEKALELKEEMARERIKSLREFYAGKTEQLAKIDSAESMMNAGKWKSAVTLLNSLS